MHGMKDPDTTSPVLGHEIRRLRQEAGLSQQKLATDAGLGMTTLVRAENSDPGLSYKNVVKIARALEVSPSAIYLDAPENAGAQPPAAVPPWAAQHHEQLQAALDDIRRTLARLEDQQRTLLIEVKR